MNGRRPSGLPSVYVRLRTDISAALQAAALAANLSAAGWARAAIVAALSTHSDIGSLPPSPRRRPSTIPTEDVAEVSRLVGAVGRATGALIQLAKLLREDGHGDAHRDAEMTLADLRAVQSDLMSIVVRLRAAA